MLFWPTTKKLYMLRCACRCPLCIVHVDTNTLCTVVLVQLMTFCDTPQDLGARTVRPSEHSAGASAPNFDGGGAGHTLSSFFCAFRCFSFGGAPPPSQFFWGGGRPLPPVPTPLLGFSTQNVQYEYLHLEVHVCAQYTVLCIEVAKRKANNVHSTSQPVEQCHIRDTCMYRHDRIAPSKLRATTTSSSTCTKSYTYRRYDVMHVGMYKVYDQQ